jgi:hypothetical protein
MIMCPRSTPSSFAPSRSIALRDRWLSQSVRSCTTPAPITSKAWASSRRFASVFSPVR